MENFSPHSKFNHLEKGFKPIRVCIDDIENISSFFNKNEEKFKDENKLDNVDFNAEDISFYSENNMLNGGIGTYVISDINSKNKASRGFFDCTGLVLVGEDKNTNKNISILTHQDPKKILNSELTDSFKHHLLENIQKLLEKSKKGSIDAIIIGGNSLFNYQNFIKSIKFINEICHSKLNFEPTVITGPKEYGSNKNYTNIYFDNENRNLHLFMPEQKENLSYHDFQPKDIDEQINKIKKAKNDKR
jgi:hypothetical protein